MIKGKKPDSISIVASVFSVKILLIFVNVLLFQHTVDASCVFTDGQVGECTKFEECPSAALLSIKGVNPGFCNLEEGTVCCVDNSRNSQLEKRPFSSNLSGHSRKWPTQTTNNGAFNANDAFEDDPNFQRKKHSVGNYNNGKKKDIEEPYKYETPNTFHSDSAVTNKPVTRPSRSKNEQNDGTYFVPPGLAKKKPWREEKTTENEYYYELITKKPTRGPNRKGSNKHVGNNFESNDSQKRGDGNANRRPDSSDQGGKKLTSNWYNNQNGYENSYHNQKTTKKPNRWEQETYTTTRRPDYYGEGAGNNYNYENENEFLNSKSTRRPERPFNSSPNTQGFQNQGNNRPINQYGSNIENNHPNSQGFQNQGTRRPTNQQVTNVDYNRPNYQLGSNIQIHHPNSRPGPQKRKRISEQKCEEYSKEITENITGLPLTTNPDPVIIPVRKCITPQQLIVGGENTTLGEFPHMAAIGFRDRNKKQIAWNCGGSLISEQFVMTAAHCTSTSSGRPVKVRLGEYNLMKNDDGAYPVDYAIVEIITHPEYKPPSKYNDIALLKLSRKVTFFKHIRPACLYSEETFSASKAIATGWGRMYYDGGTSEILQKVVLSIVDNYTCNRLYKVNVKTEVLSRGIVDTQLCAGELTGGKDTCQGDSGGPLSITSTKCIHHIIGITSFGKSCALPNSTGVYTRVSAYIPWIESVVWSSGYN